MALTAEQIMQQLGQLTATMTDITRTRKSVQEKVNGGGGGGSGGQEGPGDGIGTEKRSAKWKRLEGNIVEGFRKLHGGEAEWNTWADDFKIMVDTK